MERIGQIREQVPQLVQLSKTLNPWSIHLMQSGKGSFIRPETPAAFSQTGFCMMF
jgi:hypothetical protein